MRVKLISLEAGRFFAAALVMLFHYSSVVADAVGQLPFNDVFRAGHAGVPYFFVLSGFIIYHVHQRDFEVPGKIRHFATRRAIRLFPMFWIVSALMLAAFLAVPSLANERGLTPIGLAADFLLLPHADAVLTISWTLRHEMVFYLIFAIALYFGRKALWLLVPWIAAGFLFPIEADAGKLGSWSILTSALNLGFGLGILAALLSDRVRAARAPVWLASGVAGIVALAVAEWLYGRAVAHTTVVLGDLGEIGYLFASAALIVGLVSFERAHPLQKSSRFWGALGGSSYLLYLVHQPIGSVLTRILPRIYPLSAEATFLVLSISAVAAALIGHFAIERPLLSLLRRHLDPRPAADRQVELDGAAKRAS